jgi:hypothetical protein
MIPLGSSLSGVLAAEFLGRQLLEWNVSAERIVNRADLRCLGHSLRASQHAIRCAESFLGQDLRRHRGDIALVDRGRFHVRNGYGFKLG